MSPPLRQPRPAPRVRTWLGAGPTAPGRARDALGPLRSALAQECLEKLELIVSELVTNAVRHGVGAHAGPAAPRIGLEVRCGPRRIRVAVEDPGDGFAPHADRRDPEAPGGWGLALVAELADAWWVEPGSPARVVAELAR